jgi:hypothetical protein
MPVVHNLPMLFRRMGKHIVEHDWCAVLVDLGVLVLGIFLGLQVTNWNEERKARQDLDVYLESLATEFANSKSIHENHVAWQSRIMESLRLTLEVLDGSEPGADELQSIHSALSQPGWPPPYPGKREVLFEMQNTGMLQRLPRGDLKSVLMEVLALERVKEGFYQRDVAMLTAPPFSSELMTHELQFEETQADGLMNVVGIDWEKARADPDFRLRVLQMHSAFASTRNSKDFSAKLDGEVLRLLADDGFKPSSNWLTDFIGRTSSEVQKEPDDRQRDRD